MSHFNDRPPLTRTDAADAASSVLSERERHAMLVEWNQTNLDFPRDQCIHQLFEAQVERTPEAVAVVCEGQSLTYRELNARANKLGHHLRSLGVGPEMLVGLCVDRSAETIVALLGILKAGGAYVPLDSGYPNELLRYILADTGLKVLLTDQSFDERCPDYAGRVVRVDQQLADAFSGNPECRNSPEHLAYVIYTSGSTGRPKGVAIEHHSTVSFLCWVREVFADEELSGVLGATSICFDLSVFEIFGPLSWGGKIIFIENALNLHTCPHRQEVKLLNTVPSVMQTVLNSQGIPTSVITVNLAGEPLRQPLVDTLYAIPHVRRVNDLYGPSETTTYSTWATRKPQQPPTIGRPIANTRVYVLDPHLNPVATGVTGELWIGGEGLARGYLNAPELTAEKFIPDPFNPASGARIYKTGDLVRYLPDGNIKYLGRADQQVKIRGFRIELGEVETVMGTHPDLSDCAVVTCNDGGGGKTLAAFVVAREHAEMSAASLRLWLEERLADFMIPSRFFVLPGLPLTPNGKVDRKALEKLEAVELTAGTHYLAARTDLEKKLVGIWESVLCRDRVGVLDNFFALGGDSLQAAQLASEIEQHLASKLPIATLFHSPTIESMAQRLTEEDWSPRWSSLVPLQSAGSKPPVFFVHGWGGDVYGFLDVAKRLAPHQPVYGLQAVGLDGKTPRHSTAVSMAALYADEIRAFQPEGPYHLAGYSTGGLIAYEVAQQLHRQGQRVAMLAILDGDPVGMISWTIAPYVSERFSFHLRRLREMPLRNHVDYLRGILAPHYTRIQRLCSKASPKPDLPSAGPPPPQAEGEDYYHSLMLAHRFQPYPGPAAVILCEDSEPDRLAAWRHLARGGISYHRVPGTHYQMLNPGHGPNLATLFRNLIDGAS